MSGEARPKTGRAGLRARRVALLATVALLAVPSAGALMVDSPGPLTRINIHHGQTDTNINGLVTGGLRCAIYYEGAFDTYCGTFLAVDGVLYGRPRDQATATCGPSSPSCGLQFTVTSVSGPTGSGQPGDPLTVVITGSAGAGISWKETNSYVVGNEFYSTDFEILNGDPIPHAGMLWRAGECFLQAQTSGFGWLDPYDAGGVACSASPNPAIGDRIIEWVPRTAGSNYFEGDDDAMAGAITSQMPFDNTCACGTQGRNAAGLSWSWSLAPSGSATFSQDTRFVRAAPPPPAEQPAPSAPLAVSPPPPPSGSGSQEPTESGPALKAAFNFAQDSACDATLVHFSDSTVPGKTGISQWSWNFGDGQTSSLQHPTHGYQGNGTYAVRLNVTDADGAWASVTHAVEVVRTPPCQSQGSPQENSEPRATTQVLGAAAGPTDPCAAGKSNLGGDPCRRKAVADVAPQGPALNTRLEVPWMAVAAAGTVVAIGLVAWLLRGQLGLFFLTLFTRLRQSDLLDQALRAQIHGLVGAYPGIHFREISRRLDRQVGVVVHHLKVLTERGMIQCERFQGRCRYFPAGMEDPARRQAVAAAWSELSRRVLEVVSAKPGLAAEGIGAAAAMKPATVRAHVRKLRRVGLVHTRAHGKYVDVFPTDLARLVLEGNPRPTIGHGMPATNKANQSARATET